MNKNIKSFLLVMVLGAFSLSACSDDEPYITPNPEPDNQTPKKETPIAEPNKSAIVVTITPTGSLNKVNYPFGLMGNNIYLDKNNNGIEDVGEKVGAGVTLQSVNKINGKGTFIFRGNIERFFMYKTFEGKKVGESPDMPALIDTKIDASKCPTLIMVSCPYSKVSSINVSGCKRLSILNAYDNTLSELNLNGLTNLNKLEVYNNSTLSGNLDLSSNVGLELINFSGTSISHIKLPKSNKLKELKLFNAPITKIDLRGLSELEYLSLGKSNITTLDISDCKDLKELMLNECKTITTIIDNKASQGKPKIEYIQFSNCERLRYFNFSSYNNLRKIFATKKLAISMSELANRLPKVPNKSGNLIVSRENKTQADNVATFKTKGWNIEGRDF